MVECAFPHNQRRFISAYTVRDGTDAAFLKCQSMITMENLLDREKESILITLKLETMVMFDLVARDCGSPAMIKFIRDIETRFFSSIDAEEALLI